jgi:hypothetical protein
MRILKIETLPNSRSWIDRDFLMLHACFQIMKDFVEKENGLTHCDYESNKKIIDELKTLYDWWLVRTHPDYEEPLNQEEIDENMLKRLMKIRGFLWT